MKRLLVTLVLLIVQMAYAQTPGLCDPSPDVPPDSQTVERFRKLIQTQNFAALEDELNDRLRRYEAGKYSDLALYQLIEDLTAPADAAFDPLLQQWVAQRPKQLMAHLVKGVYHMQVGYAKRGKRFIENTSVEQVAAMEAEFAKALPALKTALEIQPDSALARAALIHMSRSIAGRQATLKWLADAENADPMNQAARWVAITALDQRWGGRPEDMDLVRNLVAKSPLPPARRRTLEWKVEMTLARHFKNITKENTKAIAYFRKAAGICSSPDTLWQMSSAAYDLEDWPLVTEAVTAYLVLKPDERKALSRRGWAKEKSGRISDAIPDYERASALGDAWAQNRFGDLLMAGRLIEKDIPRARRLFEAAAAQGNRSAQGKLDSLR